MEERRDKLKELIQTWAAIVSIVVMFATAGVTVMSRFADIEKRLEVVVERQNVNTTAIAAFTAPGPRFTWANGVELRAEFAAKDDKRLEQINGILQRLAVIEHDLKRRPQ